VLLGVFAQIVKSLILIVCIFILFCERGPEIDFFKEDIKIEIEDNRAKVSGIYFFKNFTKNRKRVKFYYPFSVDSNHSYPETILLDYLYEKDSAGIYFTMRLNPQKIDSFKITYEQRLRHRNFRYITTTTRKWQRPIKEANFTIIMPEGLSAKINYSVFKDRKIGDRHYYYIYKRNFYPEEDLKIQW